MRSLAAPFVAAPPSGARIRTRLRVDAVDERVLWAVGVHLGHLASQDLTARCRLGAGDDRRADRKRALTASSSSRWAGAITRCSNDQWQRGHRNLLDERAGLRRACRTIRARLAVPVGCRQGRVCGYANQAERFCKQSHLRHLEARLVQVEQRLTQGRVSVCRGGRHLAKLRHALDRADVTLTIEQWRDRWQAARLFLTADGEAGKRWGNETIRVYPDEQWLELRLPAPLAPLSNTPGRAPTYRLACPVTFGYRTAEWAAQAASGAVAYTIWLAPVRGRWSLDASWRLASRPVPSSLEALRQHPALAVDLNADHLASWVLDPAGNPLGAPHTIPLTLDGLPASTRDGHLRQAVAHLVRLAKAADCRAIVVENLDFTDARQTGRETLGRGRRGKRFRRAISSIPARQLRQTLAGMAANAGLWVIAVDPAWTSVWGGRYWQAPLNHSTKAPVTVSRHHAAAVVIGRRGLECRARRRGGCARRRPEDRIWRAADSAGWPMACGVAPAAPQVVPEPTAQGPGGPGGQRAGPRAHKTRLPERCAAGDQATQDRFGAAHQRRLTAADAEGTVDPAVCMVGATPPQ